MAPSRRRFRMAVPVLVAPPARPLSPRFDRPSSADTVLACARHRPATTPSAGPRAPPPVDLSVGSDGTTATVGGVARSASIETRLRNVSAINACLLLLAGFLGIAGLKVAEATVQDVVSRLDPLAETNREMLQSLTDARGNLRDFQLTGADPFLTAFRARAADFDTD